MDIETIDHTEAIDENLESPMIHIRTGIFLYLAIYESALTLALFLREIFMIFGVEPQNNLLWSELFITFLILIGSPFIARMIKKRISLGQEASKRLLRNVTLVFILTIIFTLLNNYYLVNLFPESYRINSFAFEDYLCSNPNATWFSYWFMIINSAIIGWIFAKIK